MITCPTCIAVRARIRAVAMSAAGRSPEKIAEALNAIYRQGFFFVRSNVLVYRSNINVEHVIKEFKPCGNG